MSANLDMQISLYDNRFNCLGIGNVSENSFELLPSGCFVNTKEICVKLALTKKKEACFYSIIKILDQEESETLSETLVAIGKLTPKKICEPNDMVIFLPGHCHVDPTSI